MSYMHIFNLYQDQTILSFRECYALEKIDGTSARVSYRNGRVQFSSGSTDHVAFAALFDEAALLAGFQSMGHESVVVQGEAYGGRLQQQTWRYGPDLRFVAFDVNICGLWLAVPSAHQVVTKTLGLEFVHFAKVSTDIEALDAERDAPSEQARRNGVEGDKPREGVVLRPPFELRLNNDKRVIAKHKCAAERETATERPVVDPANLQVLMDAEMIADEWVTPKRLQHVLDKVPSPHTTAKTGVVVAAMTEDVLREARGEIVDSKPARKAIGSRTAKLYKMYLTGIAESVDLDEYGSCRT